MTFDDFRKQVGEALRGPDSGRIWDLMVSLRGPDTPSERPDMSDEDARKAYAGRRERKARTGEVIRFHAFGGKVGGGARSRGDRDYIELPPHSRWDHYDRHAARAAALLGLKVVIKEDL